MATACLQVGLSVGRALPQTVLFPLGLRSFFCSEGIGLFFGLREQEIGSGVGTRGSRKGKPHRERRRLHMPLIQPPAAELVLVNRTSRSHRHLM